jgi:manganese efflux pump family protein
VSPGTRLRVAIIFGVAEAGMPVAGLALGHSVASSLGRQAHWIAGALLVGIGAYTVIAARRAVGVDRPRSLRLAPLILTGLALSLDNLVAGFALGSFHIGVLFGALVFGAVSVVESLAGLEFGARIGKRAGEHGELIGGAALIGVGAAIAAGALG